MTATGYKAVALQEAGSPQVPKILLWAPSNFFAAALNIFTCWVPNFLGFGLVGSLQFFLGNSLGVFFMSSCLFFQASCPGSKERDI